MPNESVNLYLSIQSGSSERTLTSLADKTRALDKETQLLQQATEGLAKANKPLVEQQVKLQTELKSSQKLVNDLQRAYDKCSDEVSKLKLDQAIENHAKLKQELIEVNSQLNANQKTYKEYLETVRTGSVENQGTGLSDIAKGMFAGQLGQMLSSSLGGLGESVLTSAIGMPAASLVSDTLSSTISGIAAGSIFGVPGMAIGGLTGAISGLISGGTEIFEAKDDAFKEYYGGLYDDVKGRSGEMVESGSTIAGGREQTRMAFAQRLGGEKQADAYLSRVEKMAAETNYDYDEITGYTKLLLNSYEPDEVFGVLQKLSDATAGLDLSSGDVNMMISGLSRMRTTGKATQEYLNYFRERGVDVDQALADDLGVEKSAIAGMVTEGKIGGEDAAQAILDFIQGEFGGLSETLAGTYDAMVDNLGDMNASLEARGGDAYNELRKEGIEAEMTALGGALGDAIGEINQVMGETQARLENLQDQYLREALEAVLLGKEGSLFSEEQQSELSGLSEQYAYWSEQYAQGNEEAGMHMESLYEQAQILGQAYYDNSDAVQLLNDVELDEIAAIREATKFLDNATQASYNLQQELSKGLAVKIPSAFGYISRGEYATRNQGENSLSKGGITERRDLQGSSHAFGLDRVPYDDYPALLHEGERVLTASEARAQDAGQGGGSPIQISITGNNFTGTPEEMADQLAEILVRKIAQARTAAAPE